MSHPLIEIARDAITAWSEGASYRPAPLAAPLDTARPVFVTLRDPSGELRGCIGHLQATRATLAEEVSTTAVLAASEDPRFPPVAPQELDGLSIEISILEPSEPVGDRSELDPRRYGVVVRSGWRRGVLLPDLDGVDTVDHQLDIARRKAGIPAGTPLELERFEVTKVLE